MTTAATAWALWVATAITAGLLLEGLIRLIAFLIGKTRTWVHLVDEEGGPDFLGPLPIKNGQVIAGKRNDEKRYPIKEASRRLTNRGLMYVLTRQKGVNLTVPNKDDIEQSLTDGEKVFFDICDPLLLAKVIKNRTVQETLEGQNDADDWRKSAILPICIVLGIAILALAIVGGIAVGS